ncbi:hypothetical protein H5410_063672 [Solanum commersonii]|uniref:Uncharacterized protein n=1 Tax=Solanum commersonii TaxID=4109 RepID=A0A9J5WE67_SOLCO|nr:hypothetical protein H5410_063672 [Solanum commersonii]
MCTSTNSTGTYYYLQPTQLPDNSVQAKPMERNHLMTSSHEVSGSKTPDDGGQSYLVPMLVESSKYLLELVEVRAILSKYNIMKIRAVSVAVRRSLRGSHVS